MGCHEHTDAVEIYIYKSVELLVWGDDLCQRHSYILYIMLCTACVCSGILWLAGGNFYGMDTACVCVCETLILVSQLAVAII